MNPVVLIVDDEPKGREVLSDILSTEGYTLAFARSGAETLLKAEELGPDVVLLDVMMPGMDGYEVCRRLRADPQLAEVPIVMVTALDDRNSRLQGIEAGADDFVSKPIDRAELRARLRTITRLNRYRHLQDERAKLEQQLKRLTALRHIDLAIITNVDLQATLAVVLQQVMVQLRVDAAAILLFNPIDQMLDYAAGQGFYQPTIEQSRLQLGEGHAGQVALERRTLSVPNLANAPAPFVRSASLQAENFQAYCGVPLVVKGQLKGVLEVFQRTPLAPTQNWLDFLEVLGGQAAIAVDNAQLYADLQRANQELTSAYDATIEGWSRALDLRDKETEGHSQRVTELTLRLAQSLGITAAELMHIRRGALLHDIGKMGVPDAILLKPGKLTDDEWLQMRQHPSYAYKLLQPIAYLHPALDIPYCHHEKWDGTGYPRQLSGAVIPLAARIFAVVDVWDALTSDRPYRPAWSKTKTLEHIHALAGTHFDPMIVTAFLKLLSSD